MNDNPKTVFRHIIELRAIVLNSAFAVMVAMILCFFTIEPIFNFLASPLVEVLKSTGKNGKLVYTSVAEIFSTNLRVAFYSALTLCFPYIAFQFWKFISPALSENEIKVISKAIFAALVLFIAGIMFAFYIVIPHIFTMFIISNSNFAEFLPKIGENVSFIILLMLIFGLSFQLPLLVIVLDKFQIIKLDTVTKLWREIILAIVVLAAIVTPPDVFSMFFLAAPLIALFVFSIIVCKITNSRKC
jgi:sec-independent protein translocase protein TatC